MSDAQSGLTGSQSVEGGRRTPAQGRAQVSVASAPSATLPDRLRESAEAFAERLGHGDIYKHLIEAAAEIERLQGLWMDAQVSIEGLQEAKGVR